MYYWHSWYGPPYSGPCDGSCWDIETCKCKPSDYGGGLVW